MAAFDFPASPTGGQSYTPAGGPTYVWNAAVGAWDLQSSSSPVQSLNDPALFVNGKLIASVAGGDLSIALVTWAGLNPSVDDPVYIVFRRFDGSCVLRTITTPMSVVETGVQGAVANIPFRLWVQMLDNAGALSLFVTNASPANTLVVVNDHIHPSIISRVLGYMDWNAGLSVPGTWNLVPNVIQTFGPGMRMPGDVVQSKSASNPGALTHSGTTPVAVSGLAVTMTPTSAINKFNIAAYGSVAVDSGGAGANVAYVSLRRGGAVVGVETLAAYVNVATVTVGSVCTIIASDAPGVIAAQTWDVRIRAQVAANVTWFAGGVLAVTEIMG